MQHVMQNPENTTGLTPLRVWAKSIGCNPATVGRFRKRGWLATVNISGRQFVSAEGAAEFHRRAAAGEFAKEHRCPRRATQPL